MEGFIQLHRKILEWEWYDDPKTFLVFLHCLLKANWKEKKWRGVTIERGTFITSLDSLSKETKISVRSVRTALKKLKTTNELTSIGHSNYTLIKLNNYDKYQGNDKQNDKQETNKRQTKDKQTTTTNKDNNVNKDNNSHNNDETSSSIIKKGEDCIKDLQNEFIEKCGENINRDEIMQRYSLSLKEYVKISEDFLIHWGEPNKSKTKIKWMLQPTFDINLRFLRFVRNFNDRKNSNNFLTNKPNGIGKIPEL